MRRERIKDPESSAAQYRLLFEANPQPMWVYDLETLAFLAVNDAAIRHYGYSREEFLTMTIDQIRPAEDVPALLENISRVRTGADEAGIWRHRKKDGSLIHVEITSHVLDFDGRRAELVLANNVTKQVQVESQIRQINEELEQKILERTAQLEAANRELEAFSYSVSHDLRAPLRGIEGFSRILIEEYDTSLPAEARRYLSLIRQSARQMNQLIEDLLAFSRVTRQSLKAEKVVVSDLVRTALEELHVDAQGRTITVSLGDLPEATADQALLKQVLMNLLSNAIKYTRGRAEARIEINAIEGTEHSPPTYYVRDNGAGFDMRYADKLFRVFQRLHPQEQFEGTGVGLAIVKHIIDRHGGHVWAEAEVDRGATFYFTLQGESQNE